MSVKLFSKKKKKNPFSSETFGNHYDLLFLLHFPTFVSALCYIMKDSAERCTHGPDAAIMLFTEHPLV